MKSQLFARSVDSVCARTRALLAALDPMARAYLETALWSSTDNASENGGEPLDRNFSLADLAPAAVEMAARDCARFREAMGAALEAAIATGEVVCGPDNEWERAGHDFWLTRNGHGAGFWDGDWPEPQASQLSASARAQGEVNAEVGTAGLIHFDRENEAADRAAGLHYSQTGTRRNDWHEQRFARMARA